MGDPTSVTIGLALSFLLILNILLSKASKHRMLSYILHCPYVLFIYFFQLLLT
jgi:hypothetical protein